MKRRIFGLETEYGIACSHGTGQVPPESVVPLLFEERFRRLACPNVFLENGARLYIDTGAHPEYATPECDDLRQVVAYDRAGELILVDRLRQAEERLKDVGTPGRIVMFKNNTDSAGHTFGCHENYLVPRHISFDRLISVLIPFFVTRQVFAGAGKVLPTPAGHRFSISQRAAHIAEEVSGTTTSARPIINTRDEPHSDAGLYRRLHVIVGDSNMSEVATYLKVATTALVIDMVEDDSFHEDCSLEHPVQAIREISDDPSLRYLVRLKDGRLMTAVQIQRKYLEAARRYARGVGPDAVMQDVLDRWQNVLDRLETNPMTAGPDVDWVTKKTIIEAYGAKHQLGPSDPRLALLDLQYHDIRPERGLRQRIAPVPGVVRLVSDDAITHAKDHPPETTRARLRGEFIRRANLVQREYEVDWMYVRLKEPEGQTVECRDPFLAHDERVDRLVA